MRKHFSIAHGAGKTNQFMSRGLDGIIRIIREIIRKMSYISRTVSRESKIHD